MPQWYWFALCTPGVVCAALLAKVWATIGRGLWFGSAALGVVTSSYAALVLLGYLVVLVGRPNAHGENLLAPVDN